MQIDTHGIIQAGFPTSAEEELVDSMSLDEFLIENKEATYMLRVTGTSMENEGILAGDMLLVERGREPKEGEIIVYTGEEGEYSMRRFYKQDRGALQVVAVVKAVLRKY
jgi:SOS-response transcriptional repressor LexA